MMVYIVMNMFLMSAGRRKCGVACILPVSDALNLKGFQYNDVQIVQN